ncbi:MAG TPA: tRNA (adenosine(37)-N6)-threonylcarbamoyltransferase complex ATPase subunit type 1 TsaE [Candidatus Limnocylindrales bacterium]
MATRAPATIEIVSRNPAETHALARRLGRVAQAGDVLALAGELGAGKTVFAKGFGEGLEVRGTTVASPSFILMAEHRGRLPLFHMDLYRLDGPRDAIDGGLLDEREADGVTLIEWPERLADALPVPRLDVSIGVTGDTERRITFTAVGHGLERYLEAAG